MVLFEELFFKIKYKSKIVENSAEKLLVTIFTVFFLFWLYISYGYHVGLNYSLGVLFILVYFCAKLLVKYNLYKVQVVLIFLFSIIFIGMMIGDSLLRISNVDDYNRYVMTKMVNQPLNIWQLPKDK